MSRTATVLSKARLRQHLDAARQRLFESITGLTEEQMRRRPDEGEWSVAEVLAYLPVSERRLTAQARALCTQPGNTVEPLSEEERTEGAARGRRLPPPALIHDLVAARWETTSFLEGLGAHEMSRSGRHPDLGELTVARTLDAISARETELVAQIGSIRRALGV